MGWPPSVTQGGNVRMNERVNQDRVAQASKRFLDVIDQEGELPLIRAAAEFFRAPVLLTDQLFHIRSVWPREATGIPELDDNLREGTLQPESQWKILDENLSGEEPFYAPFYTDSGLCAACPRLYGELVWQQEVRGHVVVYLGNRPLQREDKEILSKLISLLCLKLHKNRMGLDTWTATLQARMEVLLDPTTPFHVQQPAVELLSKEIKGGYGIMVTTVGSRPSQRAFADYAVMQIQQRFRNIVVVIYDGVIVTLFGEVKVNAVTNELRPENNQLVRWLFSYFEKYDLISGVSDYFEDVREMHLHYRRALLTTKMIERMKGTSHGLFNDFMPMPMIAAVLESEMAETFLAPVLQRIWDYDQGNGTEFFRSMYAYVMKIFDKEAAAAALGIHKNTLVYRLSRITELFQLDLGDRRVRLNLLLSCCLWFLSRDLDESWATIWNEDLQ